MPKRRPPYSAEFRHRMVELVRAGRTPEELAQKFEGHAKNVENYCRGNSTGYVRAPTAVPFDQLVLKILKRGGLVG